MKPLSNAMLRGARTLGFALALTLAGLGAPAEAGRIQKIVSPGGIEAWLVEDHSVPLIAVNFAFHGGSTQDPAGKEGIANLISTLFDEGAGDLVSADYQEKLEELAMRMSFSDSRDWFYGEMKAISSRRAESFDLLALALNTPRFDAEAIERMRRQAISGLRREEKDPDTIAGRIWAETLYGTHPYGRPASGTPETVAKITADDLRAFYRNTFARDGLKVGVVGDIDAETLKPLLDKVFGGLPAKGNLVAVADITPKLGETIHRTMEIPQTVVRFALPGVKRNDPDFMAAYIMNHILGGGTFSSWLYSEVREKRGLAYSVSSSLAPNAHSGLLVGGLGTRGDAAGQTLDIIRQQVKRMADVGPTPEELAKAKAYLVGSYALRFDTSDKIADLLVALQTDDLGIDYIDRRNGLVEAITLDDIRRVSKRLLTGPMTVVTVGADLK